MVAITPAVAGPFDVGTVVVRQALDVDPLTAQVRVDGSKSDPIPHVLAGIPLKLRDLRVNVDRDKFALNPTSCEPFATRATLFGGGSLLGPPRRRPGLALGPLPGGRLRRPALQAPPRPAPQGRHQARRPSRLPGGLPPRPGDANLRRAVVRLPRSAFLDQAHIRTICTRVQFAADNCPPGSIYGQVTAFTPLLDEPLRGPAYLRSSDNDLPDLVFDLHGLVDFEASARIDSIRGGIRATFPAVPDVPLSEVTVRMQGGKKGLIVNSRDLCAGKSARAEVNLLAHSERKRSLRPKLKASCGKERRGRGKRR